MISIFNSDEVSSESQFAEKLKNQFIDFIPGILESNEQWVNIYIEPNLNNQRIERSDIIVIGSLKNLVFKSESQPFKRFKRGTEVPEFTKEITLKNFILVIELKRHDISDIKIENNDIFVPYTDQVDKSKKLKNATKQNFDQIFAINDAIKAHRNIQSWPMRNLAFINIKDEDLEKNQDDTRLIGSLITSDQTIEETLRNCALSFFKKGIGFSNFNHSTSSFKVGSFKDQDLGYFKNADFLSSKEITILDQQKMIQISKERNDVNRWFEECGTKMLLFSGHGGTGKTIRLLQLAHKLKNEDMAIVLFLTYNVALRSNLQRLAMLMKMNVREFSNGDEAGIVFDGVKRFCQRVIYAVSNYYDLGIIADLKESLHDKNDEKYQSWLKSFADYRVSGAITDEDVRSIFTSSGIDNRAYDYVVIDECQDWHPVEKDIINLYFGHARTICAYGIAQEIRGKTLSWTRGLSADEDYRRIALRKSVRMKRNLAQFIKEFSQEVFHENSYESMDIIESGAGGKITIIEGEYTKEHHNKFIEEKNENFSPIDLLLCIPTSLSSQKVNYEEKVLSSFGKNLISWGNKIWDATNSIIRESMPSIGDLRIVNYESCRGLEGWRVLNMNFDEFWDHKISDYIRQKEIDERQEKGGIQEELFEPLGETFTTIEEEAVNETAKWALIALTRGVSEITIHIKNRDSWMGKTLWKLSQRKSLEDFVIWIGPNKEG